jgi:undecaprenyl diphosphate synthase
MDNDNILFKAIGRDDPIPKYLQEKIDQGETKTKNNTGLIVILALNYGARQEIIDAVKRYSADVLSGKTDPESLSIEEFSRYLYTIGLPDPDLLIRTSGEMRISNFLLWQLSYAEFYFLKKYWPDFKPCDLEEAILEYQKRQRRFGGINADKKGN